MGNLCPLIHFSTRDTSNKSTESYDSLSSDGSCLSCKSLKSKTSEQHFSPNCTKRPYRARRTCTNCEAIFYSYILKDFCSDNCKHSAHLQNIPDFYPHSN